MVRCWEIGVHIIYLLFISEKHILRIYFGEKIIDIWGGADFGPDSPQSFVFATSLLSIHTFGVKTKTCGHQNREVSKYWCFSKLTTPRFAKICKYIRVCKKSNTMGVTCWAETTYPFEGPVYFSDVCLDRCAIFCKWLFVLLSFFFWPLYCLWFDIRLLITSLVSSNRSYRLRNVYAIT